MAVKTKVTTYDRLKSGQPFVYDYIPSINIPVEYDNGFEYLFDLVNKASRERYQQVESKIQQRIYYELEVIKSKSWEGFFLFIWDAMQTARKKYPGILFGYGFGNSCCSIVNYLLEITDIDPIRYNLPFERFITVSSSRCPEFVVEIDSDNYDNFIGILNSRYGDGQAEEMQAETFRLNVMNSKSLVVLKMVLESIGITDSYTQDYLHEIPLDDNKTLEVFRDGKAEDLYQFEGRIMRKWLKELKPYSFTELTALNAMYRPESERLIPEYIKRKNGLIPMEYSIPQIGEVLDETYGLLVYQEQIILLAELIANMDAAQAESFRLAIFKRDVEERDYFHTLFLKGGVNNGHPQRKLEETFEYLWQHGRRTFSKAHTVSTTLTAYHLTYASNVLSLSAVLKS